MNIIGSSKQFLFPITFISFELYKTCAGPRPRQTQPTIERTIGNSKWRDKLADSVFRIAMKYLECADIVSCEGACKTWNRMIRKEQSVWKTQCALAKVPLINSLLVPYKRQYLERLPSIAFGEEQWKQYFGGDVGAAPPLPLNIHKILRSSCPFTPGKRVEETHLLVLIPATFNGKPLTIRRVEELVRNWLSHLGEDYRKTPFEASYWVLMTKDIIQGSRGESYQRQQELVARYPHYQVPKISEAAIAIFAEYRRTGIQYFSPRSPLTPNSIKHCDGPFTRCQELNRGTGDRNLAGFASTGIAVFMFWAHTKEDIGSAAVRRL